MNRRDKIINNLKEMMVANPPGQSGGFTSSSDAKGPVAGFDSVLSRYKKKKNGQVDKRSAPITHRPWLKNVKEIINT
jgi:hypothetical protein